MPTLLLEEGFKFFFYANEHLPMHIHVVRGGGYAKIDLTTFNVVENYFKKSELKRILEITRAHRVEFMEGWHAYFNKR